MVNVLLVGLGGLVGSMARYLLGGWVHQLAGDGSFPFGTLVVNVVGCLVIGFLGGLSESRQVFSPEVRLFLLIGLLGGFTTFSTFGYETLALVRDGQFLGASMNVLLQAGLGLLAVWIGYNVSQVM